MTTLIRVCPAAVRTNELAAVDAEPTTATHCIWCGELLEDHTALVGYVSLDELNAMLGATADVDGRTDQEHNHAVRREEP